MSKVLRPASTTLANEPLLFFVDFVSTFPPSKRFKVAVGVSAIAIFNFYDMGMSDSDSLFFAEAP